MKSLSALLTLVLFTLSSTTHATEYKFATVEEGRAILRGEEAWFTRLGSAEIAIRMEAEVPDQTAIDLKAMYAKEVLAWTPQDIAAHRKIIASQEEALAPFVHLLPDTVWFVKMSGRIEGGMPHTRANAIFLPDAKGRGSIHLFLHELFHVLSRNQSQVQVSRRDTLYNIIKFEPCHLEETDWMKRRRLSNPDVPSGAYYLGVEDTERDGVIPWLFADHDAFGPDVYGGFGGHFGFGLLSVGVNEGTCTPKHSAEGVPVLLSPAEVPGFFAAIGRNTGYIIHPEEVLADNFVFLLTAKTGLPNPEIVEKLGLWLAGIPKN